LKKHTVSRFIFAVILGISQIVPSALAQQPGSLVDKAYKDRVLQKIASLLESKYVLSKLSGSRQIL
jgi:hypothetical protein